MHTSGGECQSGKVQGSTNLFSYLRRREESRLRRPSSESPYSSASFRLFLPELGGEVAEAVTLELMVGF